MDFGMKHETTGNPMRSFSMRRGMRFGMVKCKVEEERERHEDIVRKFFMDYKNLFQRVEYVVQQYKTKKAEPSTLWNGRKSQTNCTIPKNQTTRRAGARCPNDVLQGEIPCEPNKEYAECDEGLQTFFANYFNKTETCINIHTIFYKKLYEWNC